MVRYSIQIDGNKAFLVQDSDGDVVYHAQVELEVDRYRDQLETFQQDERDRESHYYNMYIEEFSKVQRAESRLVASAKELKEVKADKSITTAILCKLGWK